MLKRIPRLHKNRIHVGMIKFDNSMLSLPFHFCYAVISLQLHVWPVIIWMDVGGVVCLEDKWGDVVGSENMCGPIIKVAIMAFKEEDLGVHLASSTGPIEETCCLHPDIPVHISRWRVVD